MVADVRIGFGCGGALYLNRVILYSFVDNPSFLFVSFVLYVSFACNLFAGCIARMIAFYSQMTQHTLGVVRMGSKQIVNGTTSNVTKIIIQMYGIYIVTI